MHNDIKIMDASKCDEVKKRLITWKNSQWQHRHLKYALISTKDSFENN